MAEYGTVVPTGMLVEDARRALSLIVHTLTHTQPLSRGHIMTGRQQANKDRPPGRMQMQSRRKVMRRPPPRIPGQPGQHVGRPAIRQDPSGGTSHSYLDDSCSVHCIAVVRLKQERTNGYFLLRTRTLGSPRFTEEQRPGQGARPGWWSARISRVALRTCTAVATKRTLLHSPAGKMHAQERGSVPTRLLPRPAMRWDTWTTSKCAK